MHLGSVGKTFHYVAMNDRGATLLETAIFLPLGLVLILVLIWGGIFITSSASFDRWMTQAPRLMTRGKESAMGKQMISQVQSWNASGGAIPTDLLPLLTSNVNASSAEDYLNGATMGVFASGGIKFSDLPPEYIYAFVYLNQGLSEAIGPTVKFPCDPTASPAAATEDAGPGCVGCEFLNPDTYDDTEWDG